ncbi:MAG: GAF domain-containing protein [Candidatus Riflebacteria bacterium]|nr:GAF domain-containing protein [Candidatus Riflebacteria bacterium]
MIDKPTELLIAAWGILAAENTIERILEVVGQTSRALCEAEYTTIAFVENNKLHYVHAEGIPADSIKKLRHDLGTGLSGKVAAEGKPLRMRLPTSGESKPSELTNLPSPRSVVCVPMRFQGRTIGTLQVFNKLLAPEFSQDDEERLQTFADQTAIAVERFRLNERLFAESRRIKGLFEAMTDGIMVVDSNGDPLMYNKAVESLFFPDGRPNYALTTYLSTLIKLGTSSGQAEVVLFKPHGVVLSNRYVAIHDKHGNPKEYVVSIRNITDQRALDRRFSQFFAIILRKSDRLLHRAQKEKKPSARRRLLCRLSNLSKNLVFLTELRGGPLRIDKEPLNLIDIYNKIRLRFLHRFEKAGIKLVDEGIHGAPGIAIRAQKKLIMQVFETLFAKGRLALRKDEEIIFSHTVEKECVKVFITFHGSNIKELITPESFDWNHQVDCIIEGESRILDLELAFIRHIIQAHKGVVCISKDADDRAIVQFDIPLDEQAPKAQEEGNT